MDFNDFGDQSKVKVTYDPGNRRLVYDELPTISVRANVVRRNAVVTANIASKHWGSGSAGRIFRLHLYAHAAAELMVKDQGGTLDHFVIPAGGDKYLGGEPKAPLYIARSYFQVKNVGSYAAGTLIASFEAITQNSEAGFAHRGSR